MVYFFKHKTAYEVRISDWSSYVCSSDLLHLRIHRQFTEFVQKNCAPIGVNEPADLTLECASECPAFMAEQFGFDEIGRDRAAIHGNHAMLETGRRTEERRVGKECVRQGRARGSTYH